MISRDHFQIQLEHGSNQAALSNLSANGTLINGALARDVVWLRQGDVVAIPSSAEAQRDGCQPVVTFSFHVHQPTQLAVSADLLFQCLSAHQLAPDVARSLRAELTLRPEPGSGSQLLRVGRAVQPMPLWEALLPDEATRNTISRNHFEVVAMPGEADRAATLSNLSSLGTLVNGACVHGQAPLRVGDTVGLGFAAGPPQGASAGGSEGGRPAQLDRLQCDGIDSVSTLDLPPPEREGARQAKRDLTRRAERLHDEVDALFDSLRRRSSVASHGS
ncbi:unnamed protein product [Prorocentrum cordatum]|uniref:FHA domain-containing protein n=1 Tax=Prorocentrum cordatum TaxID=2364126 RepID=A0ABN9WT60_9DINO|nr:unnamed protein product [Polarella glacialis]